MSGLETAASIVELAAGLRALAKKDRADAFAVRRAIEALRTIYFTPGGTLSLLEDLADGNRPSPERVRAILPDFNDGEWQVLRELQQLDFDKLRQSGKLSLRQCRILAEIGHGKQNLRASIQSFLNKALTTGGVLASADAQKIAAEVRRLNALIEDAEDSLR